MKTGNFIIKYWYGRLGNNIIQVQNAIFCGLYYNYNIIIPPHNFFNKTFIKINTENNKENINIELFFYREELIKKFSKHPFENNKEKCLEILLDLFVINYKDLDILDNNDCLIHIRSGDLFIKNPHSFYIPPPLSYYTEILNKNKFNKIYLISEDNINPCISKLLKLYPNIIYQNNNLVDNIKLILSAQNIITSIGTFVESVIIFTKYTKKIYKINYNYDDSLNVINENINKEIIDYTIYKKNIGLWENNSIQNNLILSFTRLNI
jgi:hypothetical protein